MSRSPTDRFTFIDATTTAGTSSFTPAARAAGSICGRSSGAGVDVEAIAASAVAPPSLDVASSAARPTIVRLEEHHYRRSEQRWRDAGKPTADVALWWASGVLHIAIDVHQSHYTFAAATAVNAYDNEFRTSTATAFNCISRATRDSAHGF